MAEKSPQEQISDLVRSHTEAVAQLNKAHLQMMKDLKESMDLFKEEEKSEGDK